MGSEWEKQGCHILNSWSSVVTIGVYSGQVFTLSDPYKNYAKLKKKKYTVDVPVRPMALFSTLTLDVPVRPMDAKGLSRSRLSFWMMLDKRGAANRS